MQDDSLGKIRQALAERLQQAQTPEGGLAAGLRQVSKNIISTVDSRVKPGSVRDAALDEQISAYDALQKAQSMGVPQAKLISGAMETFLGRDADPQQKAALAEYLSANDDMLSEQNIMTMTARGVRELGLRGGVSGGQSPSAVQEYNFYKSLSPQEQQDYLRVKRAEQYVNLGGQQRQVGLPQGAEPQIFDVTPRPENTPEFKAAQEAAKLAVEQEAVKKKNVTNALNLQGIAEEANRLLDAAGGGGVPGVVGLGAKRAIGYSDEATQANTQLQVVAGRLTAAMPRMEGPQSNYDVQLYREMAGDVANPYKSIGDRKAALQTLLEINKKYSNAGNISTPTKEQMSNLPVSIKDDNDYEALPSGTVFIDPEGQMRVKP